MSVCASNTDQINVNSFGQDFDSSKSVLPSGTGFSQLDSNGVVDETALNNWINSLITREEAKAPTATSANPNPAEEFARKAQALRSKINTEYCYYYVRYTWGLTNVLTTAATVPGASASSDYINRKERLKTINGRLNQILQVAQALKVNRETALKNYYSSDLNMLNKDLDATRDSLIKHSKILATNEMEMNVRKAMVDYTLEKNSSSRNMLGIYVFMNIVAGGLLYYIYKTSRA
jgi:hypothetical protein